MGGEIDLFFGCRYSDHDWLYKDDMLKLKEEGILANLYTAFSRDDKDHRVYVQDKIRADADRFRSMVVHENCSIYICGDGNAMAKDVQEAIVEVLAESEIISDSNEDCLEAKKAKAKAFVEQMKATNKFVLDIWS